MVDITQKIKTLRICRAEGFVRVGSQGMEALRKGKVEKGDVFEVSRVAGIMAAKRTSEILPLCHNIPLQYCSVDFELVEDGVRIVSEVKSIYFTGVEMEALTAVSVAALTLYDMLKPIEKDIEIGGIRVIEKKGGKSDFYDKPKDIKAAVITVSDSVYEGKKEDKSGRLIVDRLKGEGVEVIGYEVIPDEMESLEEKLKHFIERGADLILTTGGTGFSQRDYTPEATMKIIERVADGISEFIRFYGFERTPYSMLSRATAGIVGKTLIINLPGSRGGVKDALNAIFPYIFHAFRVLRIKGGGHAESE